MLRPCLNSSTVTVITELRLLRRRLPFVFLLSSTAVLEPGRRRLCHLVDDDSVSLSMKAICQLPQEHAIYWQLIAGRNADVDSESTLGECLRDEGDNA